MKKPLYLSAGFYIIGIAFALSNYHSTPLALVSFGIGMLPLIYVVVPSVSRLRIILKPSGPGERDVRIQTCERENLYAGAVAHLLAAPRNTLFVYAPTGAWHPDAPKYDWFQRIANSLLNDRSAAAQYKDTVNRHIKIDPSPPLAAYFGVFGLPPFPIPPRDSSEAERKRHIAERAQFRDGLKKMERLLQPLNGIDSAQVRYLRTDVRTVPGMGAIIFDPPVASFALATGSRYQMDYGVAVNDTEITLRLHEWFHNNLWAIVEDNILQDMKCKVTLTQGFAMLRREYSVAQPVVTN